MTGHALDRWTERVDADGGMRGRMKSEVRDALRAGRCSSSPPVWVYVRAGSSNDTAYCWSEAGDVVFVISRAACGHGVVVRTVLARVGAAA